MQAEVVQNLFPCLHDSDSDARLQALVVVCRIAHCNPAYALPTLRSMLSELLAELRFSAPRGQQNAATVRDFARLLCRVTPVGQSLQLWAVF